MSDATNFLYPFIDADERDTGALLIDLSESARAKARTSAELRQATLQRGHVMEKAQKRSDGSAETATPRDESGQSRLPACS